MALPSIPPLNFQSSSGAEGQLNSGFDASGFNVQYGGGVPGWLVAALVVGAVWWMVKKH